MRFGRRQEVIREPAGIEQRPLDLVLRSQHLAEGFASGGIVMRLEGISLGVAYPLRRNEPLAGARASAGGEERCVSGDEIRRGNVYERDDGGGICHVKDVNERGNRVV